MQASIISVGTDGLPEDSRLFYQEKQKVGTTPYNDLTRALQNEENL